MTHGERGQASAGRSRRRRTGACAPLPDSFDQSRMLDILGYEILVFTLYTAFMSLALLLA